jgi:hypothetical protein
MQNAQEAGEPSRHISPSFQFVSLTPSSFKQGKPRQHPSVRRHIMLDRYRRESILAMQGSQVVRGHTSPAGDGGDAASLVAPITDEVTGQQEMPDTKETCGDAIVKSQLKLVKQHPAAWMLDPFGSFAAPVDMYKQAALEYCKFFSLTHSVWNSGEAVSILACHAYMSVYCSVVLLERSPKPSTSFCIAVKSTCYSV